MSAEHDSIANADRILEEWVLAHFTPGDREEAMRQVLANTTRVLMPRMWLADQQDDQP